VRGWAQRSDALALGAGMADHQPPAVVVAPIEGIDGRAGEPGIGEFDKAISSGATCRWVLYDPDVDHGTELREESGEIVFCRTPGQIRHVECGCVPGHGTPLGCHPARGFVP